MFNSSLYNSLCLLPFELRKEVFSWCNLEGPYVKIIKGEPASAEKSLVAAIADNKKTPLIEAYHFIINDDGNEGLYYVGFCKKSAIGSGVVYRKEILDYSTQMLVLEKPELLSTSITRDRLLIKCLEQNIKRENGLIAHRACNRSRLISVCRQLSREINSLDAYESIQQEALSDLLYHVAYGEQKEAAKIIKVFPEFLLPSYKKQITDFSQMRTFEPATAFQLAVWNDDWHMYKMMLKCIPKNKQETYVSALCEQFDMLNTKGLKYTLDKLKICGLHVILNGELTSELKASVKACGSFLFIINSEKNVCSIGFCDKKMKEYKEYELKGNAGLGKNVHDICDWFVAQRKKEYPYYIVHDNKILSLVKTEIEKQGGSTTCSNITHEHDLNPLLNAWHVDKTNKHTWADAQHIAHWRMIAVQYERLLPANVMQWWMHPAIGWNIPITFFYTKKRPPAISRLPLTHPFSSYEPHWVRSGNPSPFVEFFLSEREYRRFRLKERLKGQGTNVKKSLPNVEEKWLLAKVLFSSKREFRKFMIRQKFKENLRAEAFSTEHIQTNFLVP